MMPQEATAPSPDSASGPEVRRPPRVLFVSHSCLLYGAERSLLALLAGLRSRGRIHPVVLLPCRGPLRPLLAQAGVETYVVPFAQWIGRVHEAPLRLLGLAAAPLVAIVFRRLHPLIDVLCVYSNTISAPFGALLSRQLGVPHVWHVREFVEQDLHARFLLGRRRSLRWVRGSARAIIYNSFALRDHYSVELPNPRSKVVYNGFDFGTSGTTPSDRYDALVDKANPVTLLLLGRIHPGKGHEDAVRALAVLRERGRNLRLCIVGKGSRLYGRRLRRLASSLGVADLVSWHAYAKDPFNWFSSSAITLLCSRQEAFGRVGVEAMSTGCPVVAADAGGLREIVRTESTGLRYSPGDHLDLADKIVRLLADRELYNSISNKAQTWARDEFTQDRYVQRIESELLALVTDHGAS